MSVMPKKPTIFLCYLKKSSFVQADLKILAKHFEVVEFPFFKNGQSNLSIPFYWVKQCIYLLCNVHKIDIMLCWFVDYHALIPSLFKRLTRKKLVCILGGFDCVNIPKWKHGLFQSWWRAPIGRFVFNSADMILPVSYSLIQSQNKFTYAPKEQEFGLKSLISLPSDLLVQTIPTGYEQTFWQNSTSPRKQIITTVAFINEEKRIWIKGIDLFLLVAKEMPNYTFQIVGIDPDYESHFRDTYSISENVRLLPPTDQDGLKEIYQKSKVYVQWSRLEGFPNVLCEAILCGCVPVGSRVFGIPEIIDNDQLLVSSPDISAMIKSIQHAMHLFDSGDQYLFRDKIKGRFSSEVREKKLVSVLQKLLT